VLARLALAPTPEITLHALAKVTVKPGNVLPGNVLGPNAIEVPQDTSRLQCQARLTGLQDPKTYSYTEEGRRKEKKKCLLVYQLTAFLKKFASYYI
jgi:hypothetical protein